MNKLYTQFTFTTTQLYPKAKNGHLTYFCTRLLFSMRNIFSILLFTGLLFFAGNSFGVTYTHTIGAATYTASPQTKTLTAVDWDLTNNGGYYGYDATKGQQIGSSGSPASSMSLSTSGISGTITEVKITTSGASSVVANVSVTIAGSAFGGSAQTISATSTAYTFSGSSSGAISINWANTSAKALYFKKIEVTYTTGFTVTFDNNGGTGTMSNQTASSSTALTTNTFTRSGYTFDGWATSSGGSVVYADGASYPFTADITLFAHWTAITGKTVTYDGNGSTGGSVPVDGSSPYTSGATVTVLGNTGSLVQTGYTFSKWNTQANGLGTDYSPAATFTISANTILYAQWSINNYTVTFNANTGTGSPSVASVSGNYATSVTLATIGTLAKTGYTFGGWNTLADGSGSNYTAGSSYTVPASNITLYAKWTPTNYTVTFDGNGSTGGSTGTQTIAYGATASLTTNGYTKTGYVFDGWATSAGGAVAYLDGASYTMSGAANVTLYAKWSVYTGPCLSEDFTGFTSGAPSGWSGTGCSNYSATSAKFDGTGDDLITPTLSGTAQSLSFSLKGNGTDAISAFLVEGYNGSSWVTIENITASIPTTATTYTYNSSSSPALPSNITQFRFTYTKSLGNAAFDDVVVYCTNCTAPTTQATAISTNTPTTDGFSVGWTAGSGNGTMIVVRPTANTNTPPTSGTAYTPNLAWASAAQIDVNNRVVFRAAGATAGPVTGLTAETQYTITGYEYNTTDDCYNLTSAPSTTRYTLSTEPSAHPTTFTSAACVNTSLTLSFSAASSITNADGYIILRRQDGTNPTTTGITDGVNPVGLVSAGLPSGTTLVTTIASTATTSYVDGSLTAGTSYNYLIIPYNANSSVVAQTYNYLISGSPKTTSATTGNASTASDIITDPTFTYNTNILYANYQGNPITNTSNSVGVFGLRLRDGGGSNDADALPTILKSITFSVNSIAQTSVRRYAIFQGNTFITEMANPGTSTITFSGLSISTITDFANADFTLRVSFNNTAATIVDNTQLSFSVASATTTADCSTSSSQFKAYTTVNSDVTGDKNRIEVVATKLAFVQQPSDATNGATMLPAVTVRGDDANNIQDLDQSVSVSVACSSPSALTSGGSAVAPSAGIATFGSLIHGTDGTNYTLTATATGLSSAISDFYNISTFVFATGDYRPKYDYDDFSYNNTAGTTNNWEYYNGSTWTTTPGDKAPQNAASPPTRILINHIVYGAGSTTHKYNDIIIQAGGELILTDDDNPPVASEFLYANKKIEVLSGGKLTIEGDIDLPSTGNLIIRSGGEMVIDQTSVNNSHPMWDGVELFEGGSTVTIKDWDFSASATVASLINVSTAITSNVNGWKFGKLVYDVNTSTSNWAIIGGGIGIINLTENNFEITNAAAPQYYITGATNKTGTNGFIVNGNMIINDGSFAFGSSYSSDPFSHQFTINENFEFNSNDTLRTHYIGNSNPTGLTGYINVKKNFTVANTAKLFASYKATNNTVVGLNLNGTGTPVQELKIYPNVVAVPITVKTGTSVLQKSYDITVNSLASVTSDFTVETGATYNWGWNDAGTTPLVIKLATINAGTSRFVTQTDATLKITHNRGLMADPATDALGNVQGITASNRVINTLGIFWYLGKTNQNTGDAIGTSSNGRNIIVELATNALNLQATVAFGLTDATSSYRPIGGLLDIRRGLFKETATQYISGSTGTLYMAAGTSYEVKRNSTSNTDLIPRMDGVTNPYKLSVAGTNINGDNYGGTILLTGDGSQWIRGNRTYASMLLTNTTLAVLTSTKNLSSNCTIDSMLNITNVVGSVIVDCIDGSGNPVAFQGNGGLNMASGRLKIKMLNTASPELLATNPNTTYSLTGGTVEFYGSGSTEQQQIRGNYGSPTKVIEYYNLDINATAANYSTPPTVISTDKAGNVDLNSSFTLKGTLNVNSPAVLRMDETDFIYKFTGNTTNAVNVNSGAGLLYGSPYGITTVGTGGTGLEPSVGLANAPAGNIRTNNRTFNTGASYGFIGNGDMVSGDGIPSTVAGLYVFKTASADVVTLSKSVLDNGIIGLYNGKILSSASNKLTLETTASIVNTPTNAGGIPNMGHENSYVIGLMGRNSNSTSDKIFPIGSSALYGPLELKPFNSTSQTYSADYTSAGFGSYALDPANSPQLDHVSLVEYWNVTSTASGANDDAKVKLFWRTHSTVNGTTPADWANLRVVHHDGTDWNTEDNSGSTISGSSKDWGFVLSPNYCADFSPFTIGTITSTNPLPVELTSFTGICIGDGISKITWSTASELNSKHFLLQRSSDGSNYTTVAVVDAAGNSSQPLNYTVYDSTLITNGNYYRLIEVDIDGKQAIYSFILVECKEVDGMNIYYNQPKVMVEINSNSDRQVSFNLYEVSGKLLYQENKQVVRGYNRFNLGFENKLAKGIYIIQMVDGKKTSSTKLWIH